MAGQSVGFVTREQSTAEILDELIGQAVSVLAARVGGGGRHSANSDAPAWPLGGGGPP